MNKHILVTIIGGIVVLGIGLWVLSQYNRNIATIGEVAEFKGSGILFEYPAAWKVSNTLETGLQLSKSGNFGAYENGKITFLFTHAPSTYPTTQKYLQKLYGENVHIYTNERKITYIERVLTPTDGLASYTEVAFFSNETRRIVYITVSPQVEEEEFNVIIKSFAFH